MANEISWTAPPSATTYLGTELNALGDGANKLGAAIDNDAGKMMMRVELALATQGSARDTGAYAALYALKSADGGSTFTYGADATDPPASALIGIFDFDAAVTARTECIDVEAPSGHFKLLIMQETGQAFGATGNTLRYSLYSTELN